MWTSKLILAFRVYILKFVDSIISPKPLQPCLNTSNLPSTEHPMTLKGNLICRTLSTETRRSTSEILLAIVYPMSRYPRQSDIVCCRFYVSGPYTTLLRGRKSLFLHSTLRIGNNPINQASPALQLRPKHFACVYGCCGLKSTGEPNPSRKYYAPSRGRASSSSLIPPFLFSFPSSSSFYIFLFFIFWSLSRPWEHWNAAISSSLCPLSFYSFKTPCSKAVPRFTQRICDYERTLFFLSFFLSFFDLLVFAVAPVPSFGASWELSRSLG